MRITPTGFLFEWTVSCPDSWCLRACRGNIRASKQDLAKRAPNLALVHHLMAGVSNVRQPAPGIVPVFWGAPGVSLTTTRGANSALPIAEYALGAIFMAGSKVVRACCSRPRGGGVEHG